MPSSHWVPYELDFVYNQRNGLALKGNKSLERYCWNLQSGRLFIGRAAIPAVKQLMEGIAMLGMMHESFRDAMSASLRLY